jgi:hypothetical protein
MKRLFVALIAFSLGGVPTGADPRRVDPKAYLEHVKFLAADNLEGRGNGSPGLETAADYIAARFRDAGLEPAGDNGTFFQRFEMTTGLSVEPGNVFSLQAGRSSIPFDIGRDYEIVSTSRDQSSPGDTVPLVFAGYGISAPAQRYDDYAGIDATDKAVLIFTHEPQENDARSAFEGQTNTIHSTMMRKVEVARNHGVKAMLVVDDPNHRPALERFRRWMREPQAEEYGLAVFYVSRDMVQRALGTRVNLDTIADDIDRDFSPRSRELGDVTLHAVDRTVKVRRPVRNVIGLLKGSDPALQGETVIVGAHYDHLGRSGRFSMSQNTTGQIHHGADDNASGTSGVIERRRRKSSKFSAHHLATPRTDCCSSYASSPDSCWTRRSPCEPIGRRRAHHGQLGSAPSIEDDLKAAEKVSPLNLKAMRGGPGAGASDDATFLLRKIPAVNFFSATPTTIGRATRTRSTPRRRGRGRPRAGAGPAAVESRRAPRVRRDGAGTESPFHRQRGRGIGLRPVFRIGPRFRERGAGREIRRGPDGQPGGERRPARR